ncbi:hypothetical protein SprV_0100013200 [Sparganum proliferum]
MIRALLQDCHLRLRKYKGVLSQAVAKCTELIGEDGTLLLQQAIDKRARELRAKRDIELADKLRNISRSLQEENDVLVHNLSSKELTPEQLKVLSHEACFNTTDADPVNLVATVESILKQTEGSDETKHLVRAEQDALKKLRADTSIVVLPADKGRSTVVLDKTDYIRKANSLLDDRQAYLRCDGEPMRKLLTQLDKTLAEMQANKVISKSVRLAVKPTDAAASRFYGLPKLHKVDVPLRPIVSLRGAPTFNLAKWLFRHLRPLTSGAATTVCSATQFLERLRGTRLTADEVMVSFDVTSLFTSIPQGLAIETTVGVFNFFITCGDGFLQGPDVYDELYYELIRMASVVEGINEFCHQTSTSSDAQLKSMANELLLDSSNMRAIVKHFEAKINAYASKSNLASLTEAQVYEVIRENYDALTLRVFEDLHTHFALPIPDAEQSEKNALLEMVQQMRRCCLDASVGFQSRFAELSIIR